MATKTDDIGADSGDLELEAMRKDDCSWHPCEVHFSPDDDDLVIKYENNDSQDTLTSEKEALTRIRFRSLPLQEDDCNRIKPGDHVVVNKNPESEEGFFDAEVEKVIKVRHSKRAQCRCSFMIKWLQKDDDGESVKVPSSSVMRLNTKSINDHPTISGFMDEMLLRNTILSEMSPQLNLVNEIDLDFQNLLEKQIEGIRNSVHCSKKKIIDEILVLEADTTDKIKGTDISVPELEVQISSDKSRSRRSKGSKASVKKSKSKSPSPPMEEPLPEDNRSPLNPLAARAALASMMSKLPQSPEITPNDEVKKTELPSETEVTPNPLQSVKKTLFSASNSSENGTRSTRGKVNKVKGISDESKSSTVTNKRFTRSKLSKEEESVIVEDKSVVEKDTTSDEKVTDNGSHVSKDENTLFTTPSSIAENENSIPNSQRKVVSKTKKGNTGTGTKDTKNFSNMKRLTRSTINKEDVNIETETEKESGGDEEVLKTKQRNKKRNTPDGGFSAQVSEGNVTRNGGGGKNGSKKNLLDLKNQKVRSSPRFLNKT